MHAIDRAITELAGRQDNLVHRDQLQAIGLERQLRAVVERSPTLKGSAVVRALLRAELETGYTRSGAERAMIELIGAAALPPPLVNQRLLGYSPTSCGRGTAWWSRSTATSTTDTGEHSNATADATK